MIEKFQTYFETLENLSTEELDRSVEKLVRAEKRNTALVIAHLAEMSRRKGALERGYKNLFDYAVRRLNLSEGSVALRLQVANVARRFPQILVALAENRISLTVAGLLAPHLREENAEKLLSDCVGKTKREAEEYLVTLRPKPVFIPVIRKTPSSPAVAPTPSFPAAPTLPTTVEQPRFPQQPSPPILQPATPTHYNFRFSAGREFKEKLERLAEVLGIESSPTHMAEILERAVDIALDRKDPKRKLERRKEKRARSRAIERPESRPDEKMPASVSRYVASEVQERVQARAGYQCEFRGPDGTRCRSRTGVEIDHVRPFALFRSHDENYLRLFCRQHNRLAAERVYGRDFIQRRIASARERARVNTTART